MLTKLHLSNAEYDRMVLCGAFDDLDRKIELIRGELTEMNPAGPIHDDLITFLTNWSVRVCDPSRTRITSQTGLDLQEQSSRPEPDLMWLENRRYRDSHPCAANVQLAIEVSDSSLASDLKIKRLLYAEAGIVEYWIVDSKSDCVHVYRNPDQADYLEQTIYGVSDTLSPQYCPNAKLSLNDLFDKT
jgi:Uma2 family endonuclease